MAASRKTGNSTSRNTTGTHAISGSMKGNSPQMDPLRAEAASSQTQPPAQNTESSRDGKTPEVQMMLNHDQIAQRAFAIWVARGKPLGQDQQNWSDAERQLRQELARRA